MVRSLAVTRSTEVASLGAAVDEAEGSLVWLEDRAGSGVWPFRTEDEGSPTVPTEACFPLTAGEVDVGWASSGSSMS